MARSYRQKPTASQNIYAIGIGSNRALTGALKPREIVKEAFNALDENPAMLLTHSAIFPTRPLGPSARTYANAAALIASKLPPLVMLDHLQAIEKRFHRRRYRRWGARTLDLDLLLWSGGRLKHRRLTLPHPSFRNRNFVLTPLRTIVPRWRDPVSGLSITQLQARLAKAKPVDRAGRSL